MTEKKRKRPFFDIFGFDEEEKEENRGEKKSSTGS